jgi:hypothetical protein
LDLINAYNQGRSRTGSFFLVSLHKHWLPVLVVHRPKWEVLWGDLFVQLLTFASVIASLAFAHCDRRVVHRVSRHLQRLELQSRQIAQSEVKQRLQRKKHKSKSNTLERIPAERIINRPTSRESNDNVDNTVYGKKPWQEVDNAVLEVDSVEAIVDCQKYYR